jgi:putrescine transport system permease protein
LAANQWRGASFMNKLVPNWTKLGRRIVILTPYLWVLLFFLLPLILILKISFSDPIIARPPFTEIISWLDETYLQIKLSFQSYLYIIHENEYTDAFLNSVRIAFFSTFFCLILGYPMAYAITKAPHPWRLYLLFLVILPFWTSFLIRVYAWIGILKDDGFFNNILQFLGIIDEPLPLLYNEFAIYIGIVYSYLPFMILSLYGSLSKIEPTLLEAAADLGARPFKIFRKVTLPLSLTGIITGSMLVFIPAIGEFVIPDLLGGSETLMIGKSLWLEFFNIHDWPTASALAILTLIILVIPILIFQYFQSKETEEL